MTPCVHPAFISGALAAAGSLNPPIFATLAVLKPRLHVKVIFLSTLKVAILEKHFVSYKMSFGVEAVRKNAADEQFRARRDVIVSIRCSSFNQSSYVTSKALNDTRTFCVLFTFPVIKLLIMFSGMLQVLLKVCRITAASWSL